MKRKQDGFASWLVLVGILGVLIIGFAGYRVANRKSSTNTNTVQPTSQQTTAETSTANKDEAKQVATATTTVTNDKFVAQIPSSWSHRPCMDHAGFAALTPGGGGPTRCIWSDAKWLGTDMSNEGRVAVGFDSNPYPVQDWSSGQAKDVYDTDAQTVTLLNGTKVKKYTYSPQKSDKKSTFGVTEYKTELDVTVFVFDGSYSGVDYGNTPTYQELIKDVESVVLQSIKLK